MRRSGRRPLAVVPVGSPDMHEAFAVAGELRSGGVAVDLFSGHRGLGSALKAAAKTGIVFAVIVGQEESLRGTVVVKNLETRSQEELPRAGLADALRARL
jgi:histidyl-tRNA synthetase